MPATLTMFLVSQTLLVLENRLGPQVSLMIMNMVSFLIAECYEDKVTFLIHIVQT
jgi:hypothetical protein